jgi:hypothetical protein
MSQSPSPSGHLHTEALLVSLNGGILLAIAILLSSAAIATAYAGVINWISLITFGALAFASWVYLLDGWTEGLMYDNGSIIRHSALAKRDELSLTNASKVTLKYEGLNLLSGIESIAVIRSDHTTSRMALGPCWRRRDLEAFLDAVVKADPSRDILILKE